MKHETYIVCEECLGEIKESKIRVHIEQECESRAVTCVFPGCRATYRSYEKKLHEENFCLGRKKLNSMATSYQEKKSVYVDTNELCPLCKAFTKNVGLAQHKLSECSKRLVRCDGRDSPIKIGCGREMEYEKLLKHIQLRKCPALANQDALLKQKRDREKPSQYCQKCGLEGLTSEELEVHSMLYCPLCEVECPNKTQGCAETLLLRNVQKHLAEECQVVLSREALALKHASRDDSVFCENGCGEVLQKKYVTDHYLNSCSQRLVFCQCGHMIKFCDREMHCQQTLYYLVHKVPVCPVVKKREKLARKARERSSFSF